MFFLDFQESDPVSLDSLSSTKEEKVENINSSEEENSCLTEDEIQALSKQKTEISYLIENIFLITLDKGKLMHYNDFYANRVIREVCSGLNDRNT